MTTSNGRRWPARGVALALVATGILATPPAPASGAPGGEPPAVPGELLVGYQPGATPAQRAAARGRAGAHLAQRVVRGQARRAEVELVRVPAGTDRSAAARRLEADPSVSFAEPNWVYTHTATATDPYFTNGSLWGMYGDASAPTNQYGSQAAEAWAAGNTGSDGVYVGVIDEGIQDTHPDLSGQVWTNPFDPVNGEDDDGNDYVDDVHGWDFVGGDNTIYDGGTSGDADDHGTHVAGTIGAKANNGAGVVGLSWDVTLISGKFLGKRGGTLANAILAVDYFTRLKVERGLNIVATNNSWGGGGYSQGLFDAIERANAAGILFVAAAGNGGSDGVGDNNDSTPHYPSSYTNANVVSVAAITSSGARSSFSNYGAKSVDLGAPGSGIWSTTAFNTYSSYSGTSMATPHVTGAAALYAAANPGAGAAAIKSAILSTVAPTASLSGKTVTGGRLNASSFAGTGTPPPTATAPSAPTGLTATGGDGRIDVAWVAPSDDGGSPVTGYRVYRGGELQATTAALSFADTAVGGGTTFTYHVTAVNGAGESGASNAATATASTPARSVTVTAGAKQKNRTPVTVTWVGFTGPDVDVTRSGTTFSTANDGELTESWRGSGTVTYTVCQTGSTTACASASTTIV